MANSIRAVVCSLIAVSAVDALCRCTPTHNATCWLEVPWAKLNSSVDGRLEVVSDELNECIANTSSAKCDLQLMGSNDEFSLSARPGSFMHTGYFSSWNISGRIPSFAVAAETEADMMATVRFAADYNIRLVIKGTGHDWYGRSGGNIPGSLMLWTHKRKGIEFHDAFSLNDTCSLAPQPQPAVTMQTGVQFADVYPLAFARGRLVVGGTCDTVGVGGCTLGGCFGTWSSVYGSSATNVLQAKVVLANGTLVIANKCSHADLFWSLRGGGAGLGGVVTEWTVRSHPSPTHQGSMSYSASTEDRTAFLELFAQTLRVASAASAAPWEGGISWNSPPLDARTREQHAENDMSVASDLAPRMAYSVSLSLRGGFAGDTESLARAHLEPLDAWVNKRDPSKPRINGRMSGYHSISYTKGSLKHCASAGAPHEGNFPPWTECHPDREISTAHLISATKWITKTAIAKNATAVAEGLAIAKELIASSEWISKLGAGQKFGFGFQKQQGFVGPVERAMGLDTAQNPVMFDSIGQVELASRVPSLPQLPPSARLLKHMWPRLQAYAIRDHADPLYSACSIGAAGDELQAHTCMDGWLARVPVLQKELRAVVDVLWRYFPNVDAEGNAFSMSYWNEADFHQPDWQRSFWGANYPRLLEVKAAYDPGGLFTCWHCVGSEAWTEDGNCLIDNGSLQTLQAVVV